jgi:hypothetical protein
MSATWSTEALEAKLCEAFAVTPSGDGRWVVQTPLLYDDGDALAVFVTRSEDRWLITDEGMTASHLFFDAFEPTEARLERLRAVVTSAGAEMDDQCAIRIAIDGDTVSAYDIGDFLQAIAQVRGAAVAMNVEREHSNWYLTNVRRRVIERLRDPDYQENWTPEPLKVRSRATYRVDLRLSAGPSKRPVALFFSSTSDKANVAALTVRHLSRAQIDVQPVLACHPRVSSPAVYRFQDEVDDDSSVVQATPNELSQLLPALQRRGVSVVG